VLLGFGGENWTTALTGSKYINFVITMLFIFGVSFLLPLVVVMLNRAGVVSYERLSKWRRGLMMGLFVFAAVATPGTDPISMIVLALALSVLFEAAIQIARIHDKRKAKLRAAEGLDALDDDEAAPFDYTASDDDGNAPGETVPATEPSKRVNYDDAT